MSFVKFFSYTPRRECRSGCKGKSTCSEFVTIKPQLKCVYSHVVNIYGFWLSLIGRDHHLCIGRKWGRVCLVLCGERVCS